ncbi:MAG: hypothetical protein AAGA60_20280 [Cyanobacteria bacterium P01_E01_bin.42]
MHERKRRERGNPVAEKARSDADFPPNHSESMPRESSPVAAVGTRFGRTATQMLEAKPRPAENPVQRQEEAAPWKPAVTLQLHENKRLARAGEEKGAQAKSIALQRLPERKTSLQTPKSQEKGKERFSPPPSNSPLQRAAVTFTSTAFNTTLGGDDAITPGANYVSVDSETFDMTGSAQATGGTNVKAQQWTLGTIQTLYKDSELNYYKDSKGTTWKSVYSVSGATRDGDQGQIPWYDNGDCRAYTATNQTRATALDDQPYSPIPWEVGDKRLTRSSGTMEFCMWMIALKNGDEKNPYYLNYQEWTTGWSFTTNYGYGTGVSKTLATSNQNTALTNNGVGKGGRTPSLVDPVANTKADRVVASKWQKA